MTGGAGFFIVSILIFGEMRPLHIRISEIPRDGLDVVAARGKSWISGLLEGLNPYPLRTCRLVSAELFLSLEGRDLMTSGSFTAEGEGVCDRCTEPVSVRIEKEFHAALVPRDHGPAETRDLELHGEDLEIGFYDGGGIDVADIFWEQVALALPVKVLCRDDCLGVCPRCGADRNRAVCSCREEGRARPFDVLKTLKGEKE